MNPNNRQWTASMIETSAAMNCSFPVTRKFFWAFAVPLGLVFVADAKAQPVLAPPAATSAAAGGIKTASPAPAQGGAPAAPAKANPPPFELGPVEIRPHLSYRLLYGDGLQSRPGNQIATTVNTVAPGLAFRIGDHWSLDYTATQTFYSQNDFKDTLGHALNLQGEKTFESWGLQFTQTYATSSDPQIETARQTKQENASTDLKAAYAFGRTLSLTLGASQNLRFSGTTGDALGWSTMDFLNYQASNDVSTGIGVGLGYDDISNAPNSSYRRFMGRMSWNISKKTGLDITGGVEARKSRAAATQETNNPTYDVALRYEPFQQTKLALNAGRAVSVSLFQNQLSDVSKWGATLSQRLLGKLNFSASFSSGKSSFGGSVTPVATNREDKIRSLNLGLSAAFRTRGTMALSYVRTHNESGLAGFGFTSNQIGLDIGFRY